MVPKSNTMRKAMRRKNRQVKITFDVPDGYEEDETFLEDVAEALDAVGWVISLECSESGITSDIPIKHVEFGGIRAEPEDEEDDADE